MASQHSPGEQLLSRYPASKVIVECERCGLRAKYDKLEMLEAGGDRPLPEMLMEIVRRKGCTRTKSTTMLYERCMARYANLTANTYAKAKGG